MWREEAESGKSNLPQNLSKWVILPSVVSLNLSRALGENLPDNSSQHHHTPVGSQHSDFSFLREEVPWLHREVIMMDKAALQRPVSNVISCRSCGV